MASFEHNAHAAGRWSDTPCVNSRNDRQRGNTCYWQQRIFGGHYPLAPALIAAEILAANGEFGNRTTDEPYTSSLAGLLQSAIECLPMLDQCVLQCLFVDHLTECEIADILQWPVDGVRHKRALALMAARANLHRAYD
ncbi:MAG: hypothetical protein MUF41_05560 [Sphingopyxis sp.]|jgi:DNA-directed RNA polymerase specialized sigma24 family protein|nr:hypothetical protein [Sphingopyxis sp.]